MSPIRKCTNIVYWLFMFCGVARALVMRDGVQRMLIENDGRSLVHCCRVGVFGIISGHNHNVIRILDVQNESSFVDVRFEGSLWSSIRSILDSDFKISHRFAARFSKKLTHTMPGQIIWFLTSKVPFTISLSPPTTPLHPFPNCSCFLSFYICWIFPSPLQHRRFRSVLFLLFLPRSAPFCNLHREAFLCFSG